MLFTSGTCLAPQHHRSFERLHVLDVRMVSPAGTVSDTWSNESIFILGQYDTIQGDSNMTDI